VVGFRSYSLKVTPLRSVVIGELTKLKEVPLSVDLPVFPEDYAYYLLSDNETLIMISGIKSIRSNYKFNLKNNK